MATARAPPDDPKRHYAFCQIRRQARTGGDDTSAVFCRMTLGINERAEQLSAILAESSTNADLAVLRERLERFAVDLPADVLVAVAEPYRDNPEVIAPLYERVVQASPDDARAIVTLANAFWLQGRGPEVVGELANRAIAADPSNRAGWHLWALSEPDPRRRTHRWEQVVERFPLDNLALAAAADNAAAVAGAEKDYQMLDLAIVTFEKLRERSTEPAQREAVDSALRSLRGWRF